MDVGALLFVVALAYGLGVLWYELLPGKVPQRVWRVAAYPFVGIWVAEALLAPVFTFDPQFGGVHLLTAVIGSIVAVIVDWAIAQARHPVLAAQLEPAVS